MTRILAAFAFLTRTPVRRAFEAGDVGRASVFFPLVGAAIGLLQLGLWRLLEGRVSSLLAAVLLVGASVWITRALHLDGVADLADGLGGGQTREDALRIMRDPNVGAFGVIALVIVMLAKVAALAALGESRSMAPALVLAPTLSRWSLVALGFAMPYAREGSGLGSVMTDVVGWFELGCATVLSAAVTALMAPRDGWILWVTVLMVALVVAGIARTRLGGVTGDVLGADVEIAEAAVLVVAST